MEWIFHLITIIIITFVITIIIPITIIINIVILITVIINHYHHCYCHCHHGHLVRFLPEVVLENLFKPLHPLPVKDVLDVQVVDLKVHLGHGDGIDEDHTYNDHQNVVSQFGLS